MRAHRGLFILAVTVVLSGSAQAVPTLYTGNGHWYEAVYVADGIVWDAAQGNALAAGGYLATLTDSGENDFAAALVNDSKYWTPGGNAAVGPWLGGYQGVNPTGPGDAWKWVTGEAWSWTNWAPGQPDDAAPDEQVLTFFHQGGTGPANQWNDLRLYVPVTGYVVEWNQNPDGTSSTPELSSWALLACSGLLGVGMLRRRRKA